MLSCKSKIHDKILTICLTVTICQVIICPQDRQIEPDEPKIPLHLQLSSMEAKQNDFSIFLDDGLNLATAPFGFTSTDWLKTGALVIATGLAFSLDPKIKESVTHQRSASFDNVTDYGEKFGNISYAGIFAGGMYLTGKILGDKDISTTGRMLVESVLYTGLTVSLVKYAVGRSRPYTNEGPSDVFEYTFQESNVSFPSGHTAIAFTVSTVLSRRINNPFASIALYGLAGFTGYQRIYDDKHWFSDVFVGAAIGYFIGNSIVDSEENRSSKNNFLSDVTVMPSLSSGRVGLSLHLDF
jgi:membrane-associated phospholipid phosphatase